MVVLTRLELATSAVTGQRSNQLSYSTKFITRGEVYKFFLNMQIFFDTFIKIASTKGKIGKIKNKVNKNVHFICSLITLFLHDACIYVKPENHLEDQEM